MFCLGMLGVTDGIAGTVPTPGCLDGGVPHRVSEITPELDLRLEGGAELHLAGLDLPHDGPWPETVRRTLAPWLLGRTVLVRELAAEPDRWNRMPALVFAGPSDAPADADGRVSVTQSLVEAGLARVRPDPATAACRTADLALEDRARAAGRGIWGDPDYAVIAADQAERLAAAVGRTTVIEGRIAAVVEGRARTYLQLSKAGRRGFAIAVPRRVLADIKAAWPDLAAWRGQPVRVRGLLSDRFGLQIDLLSADQIEFTGRP